MAQKASPNKAGTGKSQASRATSTSKTGAKKPSPSKAKQSNSSKPITVRREVWAGIYLFFAFISLLNLLPVEGFFIDWYKYITGWLIGYGADILPVSLLFSGILLIVKRKGKARFRVTCAMLAPIFFGAVRHVLANLTDYPSGLDGISQLAKDGVIMQSGGLISGGLGMLTEAAVSNVGAVILLMALFVLSIFFAFNSSLGALWSAVKKLRPSFEPEGEDEPKAEKSEKKAQIVGRNTKSKMLDIDIDEDENVVRLTPDRQKKTAVAPPNVPTPAQAIRGLFQSDKQQAEKTEPEPVKSPVEPIVPVFETNQAEIILPDAVQTAQIDKAELEQAQQDTAEEIEQALTASTDANGQAAYIYPPVSLLKGGSGRPAGQEQFIIRCAERLIDTLFSFGVEAEVIGSTIGPTVTRYELLLKRGIKFSKVSGLSDDIALALGANGIRISTIPDKNAIGIEVPNEQQELVTAGDIINGTSFKNSKSRLSFSVGKDIAGNAVIGDIARMPHMLIAGTTGSGKSVCVNSIIVSLLYKSNPDEVRLIMIDPKMIELNGYNGIPHLLIPVVTDPKKAAGALSWAVSEMMKRYKLFSEVNVRDLAGYNLEMSRREDGETLPQIVIVIDELADLMAVARSEVEEAIIRIAQMARAAGMHLIIATQRPSADVITGLMKTNIPSRIAFAVASAIDSRIILDQTGAEKLLGKGDMLYSPLGAGKPLRVQGCFLTDKEVEEVVTFIKQSAQSNYDEDIEAQIEQAASRTSSDGAGGGPSSNGDADDELFWPAVNAVVEVGQCSVSMLQRRLKLGFSRAARLVDIMEERGIVGPYEGSKPRSVLITKEQLAEMTLRREM